MIGTQYKVLTPHGSFMAQWDENPEIAVQYSGNPDAIAFFRASLNLRSVSGAGGALLSPETLEPADLYGFCQSDEWGIVVMPEFDDLIQYSQDNESTDMNLALDAVDDSQAFALMGEAGGLLKGLNEDSDSFFADLNRLREIIGLLGEDVAPAEKDIDKFASLQGLLTAAGIPNKIYQGNIALAKGDGKYVQQYTNNKQADARVAKLREAGFIAHVTARHPFIIIIDGLAAEPIEPVAADPRDKDNYSTDPEGQRIKAGVNLKKLSPFLSGAQRKVLDQNMRGEEGEHFVGLINDLWDRIVGMPVTYGQDGMGDKAIVYLHYSMGSIDSYITEKDAEGDGTEQAFGFQDLGYGGELGYINIAELVSNRMELDLYWTPKTLAAVKNGGEEPVAAELAVSATSIEKREIAQGMVEEVAKEFGGGLGAWADSGGEGWQYAPLAINGEIIRIGTSGGGVVQVNGNPFDPDGKVNDTLISIRESIAAVMTVAEPEPVAEPPYKLIAQELADIYAASGEQAALDRFNEISNEKQLTVGEAAAVKDAFSRLVKDLPTSADPGEIAKAPLTSEVTENPEMIEAKKYLQSVIDGSADMLDPEVPERFNAMYEKFTGDAGFDDLMNRAVEAYTNFAMGESAKAMA
jgi:hypothetical protein